LEQGGQKEVVTMKGLFYGFTSLTLALTFFASSAMAGAPTWMKDQYVDIYYGSAGSKAENVTATITKYSLFGGSQEEYSRKVDFTSSSVLGGRWGFWLETDPLYGFAVDVSYQSIKGENVKIDLLPISCMFFFRYPWLPTEKYPYGRIQPYGGIGLSLLSANMTVDFTPDVSNVVSGGGEGIGVDLRAGLKWMITEKVGVFTEVRHLQGKLDIEDEADIFPPFIWSDTTEEASTSINSQQLIFGISVTL
jgi:opacity protein-like surface antigen